MNIELIAQIFELIIIPLLGIITTFIIKLVNKKVVEIDASINNETASKYLEMLNSTVTNCVLATTQTYVDSLKSKGEFTKEAQKEAFNKTYSAVMAILSEDAIEYLNNIVGDLNTYIESKIESEIKINKVNIN